jgi:hypothetical protein
MSDVPFSYADYESTRVSLLNEIKTSLLDEDKYFLLSVNRLEPDWSHYAFEQFPSIQWKLLNLEKFKNIKTNEYQYQLEELEKVLSV